MSKIIWDAVGSRKYETGIDRGVLYVDGQPGVPWNGLTSISESSGSSSAGSSKSFYVDGEKYLNLDPREEYQATLTAYTYPEEFEPCNGDVAVRPGLFVTKQKRVSFGLCYRTMIGNDLSDTYGYKLHLIYNLTASPANKSYKTVTGNTQLDDFSWTLTSLPPVMAGYRRTAHIILTSTELDDVVLSGIEDILYGSTTSVSRLPTLSELSDIIDTNNALTVVDNGDGTFTVTAPLSDLVMLDDITYQLTWPTAVLDDANTFTVSS